jgi:hypothetical protein
MFDHPFGFARLKLNDGENSADKGRAGAAGFDNPEVSNTPTASGVPVLVLINYPGKLTYSA